MDCQTVKEGMECAFMTKKGCTFNGGSCHTIVEQCETCGRILEIATGRFCAVFPDPAAKWRIGTCNRATHAKKVESVEKHKLNPLKASKRKSH
jgi:hypothetical protein